MNNEDEDEVILFNDGWKQIELYFSKGSSRLHTQNKMPN